MPLGKILLNHLGLPRLILVLTCFTGCVNQILSWKALVPLARLSYGAFLVHMLMQQVLIFSTRTNVYIDASTPVSIQIFTINSYLLNN